MRIAVVQLGSRTVRLLVAVMPPGRPGRFQVVAQRQEVLRLDAVVTARGHLPGPALDRVAAALGELEHTADEWGIERLEVLASGWVWQTADTELEALRGRTGLTIRRPELPEMGRWLTAGALAGAQEMLAQLAETPATLMDISPTRVMIAPPAVSRGDDRPVVRLPIGPQRWLDAGDGTISLTVQQQFTDRVRAAVGLHKDLLARTRGTRLVTTGVVAELAAFVRDEIHAWPPGLPVPRRITLDQLGRTHQMCRSQETFDPPVSPLVHPTALLLTRLVAALPLTGTELVASRWGWPEGLLLERAINRGLAHES